MKNNIIISVLVSNANKSKTERLHCLSKVYIYLQDGITAYYVATVRCFFYLFIPQFCLHIGLNQLTTKPVNFPITGSRLLRTGRDSPAHCGQNCFGLNKGTVPGFFIISTYKYNLLICGSQMELIDKSTWQKIFYCKWLSEACWCLLQHASIRYHMYLILLGQRMIDAVSFAYGWGFRKAGKPVPPISSAFAFPLMRKVQVVSASGSHNS